MITRSLWTMAGHVLAERAMLNVASGGTADRDARLVAVKPTGVPSSASVEIAATPAAWRRKACLNAARSRGAFGSASSGGVAENRGAVVSFIRNQQSLRAPHYSRLQILTDRLVSMIQTIDLRGTLTTPAALLSAVPRAQTGVASASDVAAELINDVRTRGGAALLDQAERLDHVRPEHVRVPAEHLVEALA